MPGSESIELLPLAVAASGVFFVTTLIISIPIGWRFGTNGLLISSAAALVVLAEVYLFVADLV